MNDFDKGCVFERGFDKDKMNSVERRNKNTNFLFLMNKKCGIEKVSFLWSIKKEDQNRFTSFIGW